MMAAAETVRAGHVGNGRLATHSGSDRAEGVIMSEPETGEGVGRGVLEPISGLATR